MKNTVILYHAECPDGFGGAWSAWKKFGNSASYIPVYHHLPPPPLRNKIVYSIDFTYPLEETRKLIRDNKRVTSIDHHISAKSVIEMTHDYSYALHNSGSVLAWKYFHPGKPTPFLLRCIEDSDLWKFKLKATKSLSAFLAIQPQRFSVWAKLAQALESSGSRRKVLEKGALLLEAQDILIDQIAEYAELVKFEGKKILAVNSPKFVSVLGNILARIRPPFSVVWSERNGQIKASLRSIGEFDVSKVASKYGGGGHKRAAGFSLPAKGKKPWQLV